MQKHYSLREFLNKRVLIVGDVGSGKTLLTANLLEQAIDMGYASQTTVIDMAPPPLIFRGVRMGGTLSDFIKTISKVKYLKPASVKAPRIMASSADELIELVGFNIREIDPLLAEFQENSTEFLFINDVSIYFQGGDVGRIIDVVKKSRTFIANGYFGKKLERDLGTGISKKERMAMKRLMDEMDVVIRLARDGRSVRVAER